MVDNDNFSSDYYAEWIKNIRISKLSAIVVGERKYRGVILDSHSIVEGLINKIIITNFGITDDIIADFHELILFKIGFRNKLAILSKILPEIKKIKNKRDKSIFVILDDMNNLRNAIAHHPFKQEKFKYGTYGNISNNKYLGYFTNDFDFLWGKLVRLDSKLANSLIDHSDEMTGPQDD